MDYITKARNKHGDKFDYSKFVYENAKTKSIIICPEHGEFEQSMDKHLQSKFACWNCSLKYKDVYDRRSKYVKDETGKYINSSLWINSDELKKRIIERFGEILEFYIHEYRGLEKSKIKIICPAHGESFKNSETLLQCKYPCTTCSSIFRSRNKTKSYDFMISKCIKKYNNYYSYPNTNRNEYENNKSKIKIICPKHGEFIKSFNKHLSGQGCFECRIEKLILNGQLKGGYSDKFFEDNPDEKIKIGYLYYIKVGNVYKIGITKNLEYRLKSIKSMSKRQVEIISVLNCSLFDAFYIEQCILTKFEEYRTFRKWSTEVFNKNIYDEIKEYFI